MRAARPTPLITPADGGRLIASNSEDTIGLLNYVAKVNFRRDGDVEARREGWVKFRPNTGLPQGSQHLGIDPVVYGKLTLLAENVRPNSDRCVIAATKTTIFRYNYSTGTWSTIGTGFSPLGRRWQTVTINGWIVFNNTVDLPVSYRVEDVAVTPVKELREVGVASVGWITEYNGFLVCLNILEVKDDQLASVMSSGSPYGIITDVTKTNHVPYRVIWSEFGEPTNWAPLFKVTMSAASATIPMPFVSSIFVPGVTRVAVVNGGPNGDTLGGDSAHPLGILVTAVGSNTITLEVPTNGSISYPREVEITRWTDINVISGYKDLQGDASHIIMGRELNGLLVVYRTKGIYIGRYTGQAGAPFEFRERPKCHNIPLWAEAVANVNGEFHLYPGTGDRFYMFDGVNVPSEHRVTDDYRKRFFDGLTATSDVWSVDNPASKEIWFARPQFTLCYDYLKQSASEMDFEVDAAAFVSRPGWEDEWFILGSGGGVLTYGRIDGEVTTWLRDGANPGGRLKWGRASFGDTFNEKKLHSYLMQFDSTQQAIPIGFKLWGGYTASAAELLLDEVIPDPTVDGGLIPTDYLAMYFQDELRIDEETAVDVDVRFIGRVMERSLVRDAAVSRNNA